MAFIPERLKQLREQHGYSYRDLAVLCNASKSSIHSYEVGDRKPKQEAIENMARALQCDVAYLTGQSDNPLSLPAVEEVLGSLSPKEKQLFDLLKQLPVQEFEAAIDELLEKLCAK